MAASESKLHFRIVILARGRDLILTTIVYRFKVANFVERYPGAAKNAITASEKHGPTSKPDSSKKKTTAKKTTGVKRKTLS